MAPRRSYCAIVSAIVITACGGLSSAWAGDDPFPKLIAARRFEAAAKLLAPSARAANPLSQYRLAVLLRSGLGVTRDEGRARALLRRSAAAGNEDAGRLLARLSDVVTTDTLSLTPAPPERTPRIAVLDNLPDRPAPAPGWLAMIAARTFKGVSASDLRRRATVSNTGDQTPLIAAVRAGNRKLAAVLIAAGARIEAPDRRGLTPLHWAALGGDEKMFGMLLGAGADVGTTDSTGQTPLLIAARRCNAGMLRAATLRTPAAQRTPDNPGVALAIAKNCPETDDLVEFLSVDDMQRPDGLGRTPLWYAAERGNAALTAFFLSKVAAADTADTDGLTPLHAAAARGHDDIAAALVASGAAPDARDKAGNTPLMLAAASGRTPCVARLLAVTSDNLDRKNGDGETALLLAIKSGKPDVIRLLRNAGASMLARSVSRDTPAKLAARIGDPLMRDALR